MVYIYIKYDLYKWTSSPLGINIHRLLLRRRNSELSWTGGLIDFLLCSLSSCFILLGLSLLYANSGTVTTFFTIVAKDQIIKDGNNKQILISGWITALLSSSLFSLIVGTM